VVQTSAGYCHCQRANTLAKQRLQETESQSHDQGQKQAPVEKRDRSTANSLPQHLITASLRTIVHGVEVTFTLQDAEETTLLTRLDLLLAQVQIRQRYSRA
jgi:hypothetical protein